MPKTCFLAEGVFPPLPTLREGEYKPEPIVLRQTLPWFTREAENVYWTCEPKALVYNNGPYNSNYILRAIHQCRF